MSPIHEVISGNHDTLAHVLDDSPDKFEEHALFVIRTKPKMYVLFVLCCVVCVLCVMCVLCVLCV